METKKRRKGLSLLLILLLVVSVGLNALLLWQSRRQNASANHFTGTYCTVDASSPAAANGIYLVLEEHGAYCIYRQGERLEEGVYQEGTTLNCYWLSSQQDELPATQLIWAGEYAYLLAPEEILLFQKFSDVPTYIDDTP